MKDSKEHPFSLAESLRRYLMRREARPFWAIFLAVFFFYPELFFVRSAALVADHWEQHYPFAFHLIAHLRKFQLPFWTPLVQCGFPVAAEGQIAVFYLPNLILGFFLPFRAAYSYTLVVHFLISGWGTYLYARSMKLREIPAAVAAFIFLFGSGYGGAYYNITSLKTLAWFPLALYAFEKAYGEAKPRFWFLVAACTALMVLAGYPQVAAFTVMMLILYGGLRIFVFPDSSGQGKRFKAVTAFQMAGAIFLGIFLSWPQLSLTYDLAVLSNRAGLAEGYAYVGSMSPLALATLLLPNLQTFFRGNSIYSGMFSVLLVLWAAFSKDSRRTVLFRLWTAMIAGALLLALGQWSPVYILLVKITGFHSFRTPMKFLIFICFGLAMLAGAGVEDYLSSRSPRKTGRKTAAAFGLFTALTAAGSSLVFFCVTRGRPGMMRAGEWFVRHFVFGKPGHSHSLEEYFQKVSENFDGIARFFAAPDVWQWATYGLVAACLVLAAWLCILKTRSRVWLAAGLTLLFFDLYFFSWRDIKRDFDAYQNLPSSPVIGRLMQEKAQGRLGRIYGMRKPEEILPSMPCANMLYGFEDIGAYSPLVLKRYYETVGQFGNVNDSNVVQAPATDFVLSHLKLLDFLDVSHVLSTRLLDHPDLELIFHDLASGVLLYRNSAVRGRAYFLSKAEFFPNWEALKTRLMASDFDPRQDVLFENAELERLGTGSLPSSSNTVALIQPVKTEGTEHSWRVQVTRSGFFVVANVTDGKWKARVNGREVPVVKADGLFQAVWLEKEGDYEVRFYYSPWSKPK